jgi:uroporphyrinogen decarboxylase
MARMSPRERVLAALRHQQPDRVPFSWGLRPTPEMNAVMRAFLVEAGLDWDQLVEVTEDILSVSPRYVGPALPANTDIWGIVRRSISYDAGVYDEIARYPLAGMTTVAEIEAYPWPDPSLFDYEKLQKDTLKNDPEHHKAWKLGIDCSGNVLEIYTWMTGLEETFINLLTQPGIVQAALQHISDYFAEKMRCSMAIVGDLLDLCYFADDLGGQTTLLFSRATYRQMIQPYHKRLIERSKQLAPHTYAKFHTDGSVFAILPDLIDAGVEVLEAVQTDAAKMEPELLKSTFGERLSFHGGISVQALLPCSDALTVEVECRRLVEVFGMGGGYIAAPTHSIQVGTPPENVLAMLRGVLEGEYAECLEAARLDRGGDGWE